MQKKESLIDILLIYINGSEYIPRNLTVKKERGKMCDGCLSKPCDSCECGHLCVMTKSRTHNQN